MHLLKKHALIFLLTLAAGVPQIIMYNTLPVILVNDSVWYLDLTRHFAAGGFFPDYYALSKPVRCMINYPLGYPLFLDLCRVLSPDLYWGRAVVLCQHLLSLGSVLLLFLIGRNINRKAGGFFAALAYALYLPRLIYAQTIMAETLFVFLSLLAVFLFFQIYANGSGKRGGVLLGTVTAWSILTKPLAVLGAGFFLICLLIFRPGRKVLFSFVLSLGCLIFSNCFYNWHFYGQFVLTTTSGSHLANRVLAYDGLIDPGNPETRKIIAMCQHSGLVCRFPGEWWEYLRALRSNGLSPQEADHLLMKASLAGIRSNPLSYIRNTFSVYCMNIQQTDHWIERRWILSKEGYLQYLREWSTYPGGILPPAEYESRRKILKNIAVDYPQGSWHSLGVRWIGSFDHAWWRWRSCAGWFFMFFLFYGLLARDKPLFFMSMFIVMNLLLIALAEAPYSRYFESFIPLALLSAILAFSIFIKRILLRQDRGELRAL